MKRKMTVIYSYLFDTVMNKKTILSLDGFFICEHPDYSILTPKNQMKSLRISW